MRIVVPYTDLEAPTQASLDKIDLEYFKVKMRRDDSYWRLLNRLWRMGDGFVIIEQDITFEPEHLTELLDCSCQWGGYSHEYYTGSYYGMGMVKFGPGILAAVPNAMARVALFGEPGHPQKHWCRLDHWLQRVVLPSAGYLKCHHEGILGHSHLEPSHGCRVG